MPDDSPNAAFDRYLAETERDSVRLARERRIAALSRQGSPSAWVRPAVLIALAVTVVVVAVGLVLR